MKRIRRSPSTSFHLPQQLREERPARRPGNRDVASVRVHVLAEERHLDDTPAREPLHLREHVADRPGALRAPDERHDAERAGVVASDRDRDPRAERVVSSRRKRRGEQLGVLGDVHLGPLVLRSPEQLQQVRQGVCPHHDVDPRCLPLDQPLILLRQAAGHDDPEIGVRRLQGFQVTEVAVELVVGVLADRARVQDDHARIRDVVGRRHAVGAEHASDPLGVMLVHLAPEGADQERPVPRLEATSRTRWRASPGSRRS